ncbi:MAG: hypothetical protein AB7H93_16725 [Vicinamibacterales bacterium]
MIHDYKASGTRSLDVVECRIHKYLMPFFGGRRMASITTADVRAYVAERRAATEVESKGCTRKRKDGTDITILERRRESAGAFFEPDEYASVAAGRRHHQERDGRVFPLTDDLRRLLETSTRPRASYGRPATSSRGSSGG